MIFLKNTQIIILALQIALTLLQENPLREDAHRAAMQAYLQLGQRNKVLQQFAECRQIIAAEMGITPTAETISLHEAIVREEIKLAPPLRTMPVSYCFHRIQGPRLLRHV